MPTQLLTPAEISALVPQLVVDDLLGATFCPTDGYSNPGAMTHSLVHAARELGVSVLEHMPVTAIHVRHGRVEGVSAGQEQIAAPVVVNATGAYAALTARLAGLMDLPVWPLKRQLYQTENFDDLPENVPMVVDASTGFHLPVSPLQLERNRRLEQASFALTVDEALWPLIQREIARRCPSLARAHIQCAWTGLYEMTPDDHPVLGRTEITGFLCGCGFSGHGFMHAPRAARLLAESLLTPDRPALELELFSLQRFRSGRLIKTTSLL